MESPIILDNKIQIEPDWSIELREEFQKDYFKKLSQFLVEEEKKYTIYPSSENVFAAFNHTPFSKVKVVIIGQDPYHGPNQANGLSFSVSKGIRNPPSLKNIFKELKTDLAIEIPTHGDLTKWANQGVLLLNATLTVRAEQAGSHQNKGWETFTDAVIKILSEKREGIIFLLWGKFAQGKEILINAHKHLILKAAHPSPLARGAFFGCKHFSKTNDILIKSGKSPINWNIE
jgi:uracil-DNA glycosylase